MLKDQKSGEKFHINVFDVSGRLIAGETKTMNGVNDLISLDLEQAYPGLYLVYVYSDNGNCFVKKLVVQR